MRIRVDQTGICEPANIARGNDILSQKRLSRVEVEITEDRQISARARAIDLFNFVSHPQLRIHANGERLLYYRCDCPDYRLRGKYCEHCAALAEQLGREDVTLETPLRAGAFGAPEDPELYVLNFATKRVKRMTKTQNASEASPCWSPDGRQIAYVSDTTRHPQIYLLDVATKQSRRITNAGGENTNPDWSLDGRLAWATKRGGLNYVAVMDPSKGESTARLVTDGGSWEHPSWAADGRHLIASRDKALFIIDTDPEGDKPVQIFRNQGNWMNPAWAR